MKLENEKEKKKQKKKTRKEMGYRPLVLC